MYSINSIMMSTKLVIINACLRTPIIILSIFFTSCSIWGSDWRSRPRRSTLRSFPACRVVRHTFSRRPEADGQDGTAAVACLFSLRPHTDRWQPVIEQHPGDCKMVGRTARLRELGLSAPSLAAHRLGEDGIMESGCAAGLLQSNFEATKASYVIVLMKKSVQICLLCGFGRLNLK
jgi:hypothetical protein